MSKLSESAIERVATTAAERTVVEWEDENRILEEQDEYDKLYNTAADDVTHCLQHVEWPS